MPSLNQVNLIGNVTRDPEIKSLESGARLATLSIATNETWKDKNTGEKKQKTEFHNLIVWGPLVEVFERYVKKGNPIYVSGKLETRSWEDKDSGKKMYRTEINVRELQMLGSRRDNEERSGGEQRQEEEPLPDVPAYQHQPSINADDLPF